MLTRDEIERNKSEISSLLLEINRNGMRNIIRYLEESGFYEAPCSTCRHHNWRGGLAEHCLGVYRIASEMNNKLPHDSLVIAGILHDICKASKLYFDADGVIADVPLNYWRNVDCRSRKMRGLQSDGTWEAIMLRMRNGKKSIERGRTCYGKPYIRQTNWMQVANIEYKTIEKIINTE